MGYDFYTSINPGRDDSEVNDGTYLLLFIVSLCLQHQAPPKKITPDFQEELYQYIGGIIRNKASVLLEIGGVEDHIHMLVGMPPTICIFDMLQAIKANSSGWINDRPDFSAGPKFAWQPGYGAFTVSHSNKQQVINYIQNQREHHQKRSFKDEFLAILVAHDIEYDPRFVFEDEHHG